MDKLQMAKALLVTEENAYTKGGQTMTAYGIAMSDSADGLVMVNFGGDTVSPDDDQSIEVETTFSVREGDEVIVSLIGADGTGKTPIVMGVIGRGDEQQGEIDTALDLATEANGAASVGKITPQHFFYNSLGAFVTSDEVTCDTFNGDGVVTNFTLSGTPYNGSLLALYVAGASVISGYSVSGTVLTFDSAPTGSIVALWSATQMQDYAKMDSDSFDVVKATETVASFGEEVIIGRYGYAQINLSPVEIRFTDPNLEDMLHIYRGVGTGYVVTSNKSFARSIDLKNYITGVGEVVFCERDPEHNIITPIETIPSVYISYSGSVLTISDDYVLPSYTYAPYLRITYGYSRYAHHYALGDPLTTNGVNSLSIGNNDARGYAALSHGSSNYAIGNYSHAEGYGSNAKGQYSHAEGVGTLATGDSQHASGRYNVEDTGDTYAEIVGNGTSISARSNAYNLDWTGNAEFQGEVYVGGCTPNSETPYPVIRYNTAQGQSEYWDGAAWVSVGGGASKAILTATILAADWTGSGPYTNSVTVSGLLSTDNPIMDLVTSATYATAQSEISAYGNIYKAVCNTDGTLVVYATSAPIVDLNIQLLCVR